MASSRVNAKGEEEQIKSHVQGGEAVEEVGPLLWNGTEWVKPSPASSDGNIASSINLAAQGLLNASGTIDRERNNIVNAVAITEGAYTATETSAVIRNYNHSKLIINLHIVKAGSGSLQLSLIGELHTVVTYPKNTGTDQTMMIAPGLSTQNGLTEGEQVVASLSTNMVVPGSFEVRVTPSGSTSWEYYVHYSLLV